MAREFSLAYLTIPGIDPVEQIKIASRAGYDYVSLRTIPMGQVGEPQVCLEKDPDLTNQIRQTLKDYNMKLLDIELVRIREDLPGDYRGAFEKGAELGAKEVLSSIWTPDRAFAVDRYGAICEQAAQFGLTVNLEFPIVSSVKTMKECLSIQEEVGAPNLKVMMDMMYVHWDEEVTPEAIKAVDPDRFGIIHLCDVPAEYLDGDLTKTVREGRLYCGDGIADLEGYIKALPVRPCSIELPQSKGIAEFGAEGHAKRCLDKAKALFEAKGI